MVLVIGAMFLITVMSVVAFNAVQSDTTSTFNDSLQKQAYAAAQAGIQQYLFDLDANNQYWTQCVPSPAVGINDAGSTANTRAVPGTTNESYAIELMPASGSTYTQCSTSAPVASMIQQSGAGAGSLRVRATGFAGTVKRTIVAQLRENNFLDNVWFTQYETDDPSVQLQADGCTPSSCSGGSPSSWSTALAKAETQCGQYYRSGRDSASFYRDSSGQSFTCDQIYFISGDDLKGPVYTDDEFAVCGTPTFGRNASDWIQIAASAPGESTQGAGGCSNSPNNLGTVKNNVSTLSPPATDSALQTEAQDNGTVYTGPTCITLGASNYTWAQPASGSSCSSSGLTWTTASYPANGVMYVQNSSSAPCTQTYAYTAPVYVTNSANAGCGIAYVQGTGYDTALTIGTANDLVVTGPITAASTAGSDLLGLVANGFIRVAHTCTSGTANITIDAAILSVQHSFIVDDYNCGSPEGSLNLFGSIAQDFRGGVGTHSSGTLVTGYDKNYQYDDRLKYEEPPDFLDPVSAAWHVVRENECTPTAGSTATTC